MVHLLERIGVGEECDSVPRREEEVLLAAGADIIVLLEVEGVDELIALMAFGPEIIGNPLIFFAAAKRWFFENAHNLGGL